MSDEAAIWESRYVAGREADANTEPTEFCLALSTLLTQPSRVLELGCALGHDAAYFASQGHDVLATDVAPSAVASARQLHRNVPGLHFEAHDTALSFDLPDASLDAVYARLSLHYFTQRIFTELARLLAPGGLLAFMCKSPAAPEYGRGIEIEPDVFESNHLRHFFSEAYARKLQTPAFEVISLESKTGPLYGEPSAWIEVIARRRV